MPFANATQPQMEALLADLRRNLQAVHTIAQGSYPAPLEPSRRQSMANLALALVQSLKALEVVVEGPTLGPNDIIIDKTVPVPIQDKASGVSGTGSVGMEDGAPYVDLTASATIALVKHQQPLALQAKDQPQVPLAGVLNVDQGVPRFVNLVDNLQYVDVSKPMYMANRTGSGGVMGTAHVGGASGPNAGTVVCLLPEGYDIVQVPKP